MVNQWAQSTGHFRFFISVSCFHMFPRSWPMHSWYDLEPMHTRVPDTKPSNTRKGAAICSNSQDLPYRSDSTLDILLPPSPFPKTTNKFSQSNPINYVFICFSICWGYTLEVNRGAHRMSWSLLAWHLCFFLTNRDRIWTSLSVTLGVVISCKFWT